MDVHAARDQRVSLTTDSDEGKLNGVHRYAISEATGHSSMLTEQVSVDVEEVPRDAAWSGLPGDLPRASLSEEETMVKYKEHFAVWLVLILSLVSGIGLLFAGFASGGARANTLMNGGLIALICTVGGLLLLHRASNRSS